VLSYFINGTATALAAHGSVLLDAPISDHSSADVRIGQTATGIEYITSILSNYRKNTLAFVELS